MAIDYNLVVSIALGVFLGITLFKAVFKTLYFLLSKCIISDESFSMRGHQVDRCEGMEKHKVHNGNIIDGSGMFDKNDK